jgi:hypothetical protein
MFKDWDSFYLLVGGGAGALIGLVFIVVTLIRGGDANSKLRAAGVFMTPIVFHLTTVLALSALATAPDIPAPAVAMIIAGFGVAGLIFAGRVVMMLGVTKSLAPSHWSDIWAYGLLPGAFYLLLGANAAIVCLAPEWAARALGLTLVALLLSAIRNAWDLVTWITAKGDQLENV